MATTLKIPKENRSFADYGELNLSDVPGFDRPAYMIGGQPGRIAEVAIDKRAPGRFGTLDRNLTTIRNVQDR